MRAAPDFRYLSAMIVGAAMVPAVRAVPPPPPPAPDLAVVQQFIRASQSRNVLAYAATLADDVQVTQDGKDVANSKAGWMKTVAQQFALQNRTVRSEAAYFGFDYGRASPSGQAASRVMLLERIDQIFGDCCAYERTETLTLAHGKIARIDQSMQFDLKLKADGRRQEDP